MKHPPQPILRSEKLKGIPDRKMRLFLAIDLPQDIKRKLARQQSTGLDETVTKKVPTQNLHITVKFFGFVEESSLPTLIRQIEELLIGQEQFSLILGENGCFPNEMKAKILWTGVSGDVAKLSALAKKLSRLNPKTPKPSYAEVIGHKTQTESASAGKEKFVPHITIASIKDRTPKLQRQAVTKHFLSKQRKKPLWFPVTEIILFQSKLSTSHPIYTKIATFALG